MTGRCVKKGLIRASAEAGGSELISPLGHTSCCHLPSQAPRYPGRVRRHLGRPCDSASGFSHQRSPLDPRKDPLASSLFPRLFVALGRFVRGREVMLFSSTTHSIPKQWASGYAAHPSLCLSHHPPAILGLDTPLITRPAPTMSSVLLHFPRYFEFQS